MNYIEMETKYSANEIKLDAFISLCESLEPQQRADVGSFDHYYFRKEDGCSIRFRAGAHPELTVKQKLADRNNFRRKEVNLKINSDTKLELIQEFTKLQGYQHDFTIFKTCVIFFWGRHNVVYYVVYDSNLTEKERFIEIEMSETHDWVSEDVAWEELQQIEKQFLPLGITPARRMRRSLQEIFTQFGTSSK